MSEQIRGIFTPHMVPLDAQSRIDEAELRVRLSRLIFDRTGQGDGHVIRHGGLVIDLERYKVTVDEEVVDLTYKEYELLRFLATNADTVFTRETLLNKVWGYDFYGGARTVDVHVRKLRAALAGTACDGLIQTVRGGGYRLVADADAGSEVQSKQVIGVQAEVVMDQPELRHAARSVPYAVNVAVQKAAVTRWGKPSRKAATGARHHPD